MRSDHRERHMKVHLKIPNGIQSNEEICRELLLEIVDKAVDSTPPQGGSGMKRKYFDSTQEYHLDSRKHEENQLTLIDMKAIRKAALKNSEEYKEKINLGKALYKILGEGKVEEESFPNDWKVALDLYMK